MGGSSRTGTQSIDRVVNILRELATRGTLGFRLLDLAGQCDIDRTTTHRILKALVRQRLAEQRVTDRRYTVGPLLFELATSMTPFTRFQELCRSSVEKVSRRQRAVATISLRSENDFVCIARAGPNLRAMTVEVGTRRPLLTSVGGVAVLIALPPAEMRTIITENIGRLARFDEKRHGAWRQMLQRSQRSGYAISDGLVVSGITAVGVPIFDPDHRPVASLALVGHCEDFPHARINDVTQELRSEASTIERGVQKLDEERAHRHSDHHNWKFIDD